MRFDILDDPAVKLRDLKQGARNVILRKAVRAGSKSVRQAAKAEAPQDTGVLAASVSLKIGTNRKTGGIYAVIGPRRGIVKKRKAGAVIVSRPSKIAHLVAFGTRPHSLAKGDRLARRGKADRQSAGRLHPGARANPFLQRAYQITQHYARADMERVIREEVAKRLARGGRKR